MLFSRVCQVAASLLLFAACSSKDSGGGGSSSGFGGGSSGTAATSVGGASSGTAANGTASNGTASNGSANGGDSSGAFVGASSGTSTATSTADGGSGSGGGACEAATSKAEKVPLYLLILLDRSGSMGDHGGPSPHMNRTKRWVPVTTALSSFLGDPTSAGIKASLRYFPRESERQNGGADGTDYDVVPGADAINCSEDSYKTPDVSLVDLPDAAAFPFDDNAYMYGTPTLPAVQATVAVASELVLDHPDDKVAIVLVTDGEPSGCAGNTVDAVAAAVTGLPFPTYVVGVGSEGALDQVAAAGGTTKAYVLDVDGDQAATESEFSAAIEAIRLKSLSCDLAIPPPPAGQSFDPQKVNVSITSGGKTTQLGYDEDCKADGWRYDDAMAPKKIVLCDATSNAVKDEPDAEIDVAFGCATRVVSVQ